jgi:hypothetical protein
LFQVITQTVSSLLFDELRTLEGEAQVLGRAFPLCELMACDVLERRQNAGEGDVHALHRVGKLQELLAPGHRHHVTEV